jgi:hypothetical protein
MALQIKHSGYTPDWGGREILLRAQGVDDYGSVWGGTFGLFDFGKADYPDTSKIGTAFYNLRTGGDDAIGGTQNGDGSPNITGINAAKGIPLVNGSTRSVVLPDGFRLDQLPALSSVVLWFWVTNDATINASDLNAFAGYGSGGAGANVQWTLVQRGVAGQFRFVIGSGGGSSFIDLSGAGGGATVLYALYIKKTSSTGFTAYAYRDGVLGGSAARSYPFNNPLTSDASSKPVIGPPGAYGPGYRGIIHRVGGRRVDPSTFDVEAWLAEEIEANGERW